MGESNFENKKENALPSGFEPELEPFCKPFCIFRRRSEQGKQIQFSATRVLRSKTARIFAEAKIATLFASETSKKGSERAPSLTGMSGLRGQTILPKSATRLWERISATRQWSRNSSGWERR